MFNKEDFSKLLIRARGDRNNKQYAEDSGVSRAYISGYINKSIDNAPTPEIIKKLANNSDDSNISYEDLMKAAGYLDADGNMLEEYKESLNRKDEKDIEKLLNHTMDYIENQEGLMLNGEILDENDILLLKQAIKNGLEYAKISNKKKYTPKQHRKNNN